MKIENDKQASVEVCWAHKCVYVRVFFAESPNISMKLQIDISDF